MNDVAPPAVASGFTIVAHGYVEARLSAIGGMRNRLGAEHGPTLPPRFLRHADEQTVVGMHAVLDAIEAGRAGSAVMAPLETCAVVAATCQSGRLATARALAAIATGGAAAITPQIVPQCSLHSVAGAVSVALGMHGPHLGTGGGPDAVGEGLLAATTLLACGGDPACRGAWLVATEWGDEPRLDANGEPVNDPVCRAIAILLEPRVADCHGDDDRSMPCALAIQPRGMSASARRTSAAPASIAALAAALGHGSDAGESDATTLACSGGIEVVVRREWQAGWMREAA